MTDTRTHASRVNQSLRKTAMLLDRFIPDRMPASVYGNYQNDNSRAAVKFTGDFAKDAMLLQKKWGITDVQYLQWCHAGAGFGQAITKAVSSEGCKLMSRCDMPMEAVTTAACISAMNMLMAYVEQLPPLEARFILDELSRQTDKTVQHFVKQGA